MAAKYEDRSNGGTLAALPRAGGSRLPSIADGRPIDDTLPPQPLKELLAAAGANLFVLSVDAGLIDTVQRTGGEQYPVFAVQQWSELQAAIFDGRCGIALLDADLVGGKLVEHISALEKHASRVVTLVAAERAQAQELMGYLSERRIHRLLIKPATLGITKLLVESAVNRCLQLRETAGNERFEAFGGGDAGRKRRWPRVAAGTMAVVGLAVAALWLWRPSLSSDGAEPPAQISSATAPSVEQHDVAVNSSERFAELLDRGAQALAAGRLAAPTGDNAVDYYLTVLSMEPNEPTAKAKLAASVDALFAKAESALLANALDDAGVALAGVRRVDTGSTRLAFLQAEF